MKCSTLLLSLMIVSTISAQSFKMSAAKPNTPGIVYFLPTTQLDITVNATKTKKKVGGFYKYAEKYLGKPAEITQDNETWKLDNITVTPRGVANQKEKYLLQIKSSKFVPKVYLNTEGVIEAINTEKPVTTIANKPKVTPAASTPQTNTGAIYTEELLMSGSVAKMAEMAAKQLYNIRESRIDLVTGNTEKLPADGESFRLVMDQLDQQEAALVALFMGTTEYETISQSFTYTPENNIKNEILFRFSTLLGIVEPDNMVGLPVYITINVTDRGELPKNAKGEEFSIPSRSVAYCIPGKAKTTLSYSNKTLFDKIITYAQFGVVYGLDTFQFENSKATASATFDTITGALIEIK